MTKLLTPELGSFKQQIFVSSQFLSQESGGCLAASDSVSRRLQQLYQLVLKSSGAFLRLEDSLPTYSCDCRKKASAPLPTDSCTRTLTTRQLVSPSASSPGEGGAQDGSHSCLCESFYNLNLEVTDHHYLRYSLLVTQSNPCTTQEGA